MTAVAIVGMHRSGTSFAAELLGAAGLDLGARLFPGDAGNPRGYFEDEDFLALQRAALARACPPGELGHPDWGWTESERLDPAVLDSYREAMSALVASRRHLPLWGWKDPRTTLLLDRWLRIEPDLRVVGVVREPWLVAASVQRLPSELLRARLDVVVRIWELHNDRLLAFARDHPGRCALAATSSLAADPVAVVDRVADHLRIDLRLRAGAGLAIVRGRRSDAHAGRPDPVAFERRFPRAVAGWRELAALAGADA